jgi:hypothetical protein
VPTAVGTFTVGSWDESTYQELSNGGKLTRVQVTFLLAGDITGEAAWEAPMCYRPDGTAVYAGLQQVTGQLGGIEGSFVVQVVGEYADGTARSHWTVVEGAGTVGLAGLSGVGTASATETPPGTYELEYEL